jgi:choline dehydrogenase
MTDTDYLVIGAGSAGAVVASRLSEDAGTRVVLLEAGGSADSFLVRMPAGFTRMLNDPQYDWCYGQDPDDTIDNRKFVWSAGKLLGGSSSINGQVYIRGSEEDHQRWVDQGCAGWSFADCLPYFTRSEKFGAASSRYHGTGGPLSVIPQRDPHPLSRTFIEACAERGIASLGEYCGGNLDGAFLSLCSQFPNGTRCSTAAAFLDPARARANLRILTGAFAQKLIFEGRRAVGVTFVRDGRPETLRATKEIIVCASAIGSPTLLMRSGIGPARHLGEMGIAVVCDRKQVGQNLQEHPAVPINKFVNVPTYNSQTGRLHMARHALQYFLFKKGPMVTPAVQAMATARTRPDLAQPNVQLHFLPLSYDIEPQTTSASSGQMDKRPTVMISASVCHPSSRGAIRLRSPRTEDPPQIAHRLLSDSRDVETLSEACNLIESLFATRTWGRFVTSPRSPAAPPEKTSDWEPYLRSHATIAYHPVGTCRMGSDDESIVDLELRVRGVTGLRVADASVIPSLVSINTNATAIMIGERAAAFIRGT